MKNVPVFQGFQKPSSDFPSVRSELRAAPQYFDLDLSTARSLAAGTAARITRGGNVLYIDQKANAGYAVVHVQDDFSVGNTPITVFPGFLAKVPFTELLIENDAQPGQVMRFIYGTDIDFEPIPGGGVSVLNAINVNDVIDTACQHVNNQIAPAVGTTVTQLVAPSTNVRGIAFRYASLYGQTGAGGSLTSLLIATPIPPVGLASLAPAVELLTVHNIVSSTGVQQQNSAMNRIIPAGWGIFSVDVAGVAPAVRIVNMGLEIR